jgi:hypothetical protein
MTTEVASVSGNVANQAMPAGEFAAVQIRAPADAEATAACLLSNPYRFELPIDPTWLGMIYLDEPFKTLCDRVKNATVAGTDQLNGDAVHILAWSERVPADQVTTAVVKNVAIPVRAWIRDKDGMTLKIEHDLSFAYPYLKKPLVQANLLDDLPASLRSKWKLVVTEEHSDVVVGQALDDSTFDFAWTHSEPPVPIVRIEVRDAAGAPIATASSMVRNARTGRQTNWRPAGVDGAIEFDAEDFTTRFERAGLLERFPVARVTEHGNELIVRAPGYATRITPLNLNWQVATTELVLSNSAPLVRVKLNGTGASPVPADLVPVALYARHVPQVAPPGVYTPLEPEWTNGPPRWAVSSDVIALREQAMSSTPRAADPFNLIQPKQVGPGEFEFPAPELRLAEVAPDAGSALHDLPKPANAGSPDVPLDGAPPGDDLFLWINGATVRALVAGPYSASALAAGPITVALPQTGALDVSLNVSAEDRRKLQLHGCGLIASRALPDARQSRFSPMPVAEARLGDLIEKQQGVVHLLSDHIIPGRYVIDAVGEGGAFSRPLFQKQLTVQAGGTASLSLDASEFYRADHTVRLALLQADGTPISGKQCLTRLEANDLKLDLAQGMTDANGVVELKDLPARAIDVLLDGKPFGRVDVDETSTTQNIELRKPPVEQDIAPDFTAVDLITGSELHLSDFKNKVVLLAFFWTNMNSGVLFAESAMMARHRTDWGDGVVLVGVCMDPEARAQKHLELLRSELRRYTGITDPFGASAHLAWCGTTSLPTHCAKRYGWPPRFGMHRFVLDSSGRVVADDHQGQTFFDPERRITELLRPNK